MSFKALAVLFGSLLVLSAIMGMGAMLDYPEAEPFSQDELQGPGDYDPPAPEQAPAISGDWPGNPDIGLLMSVGKVYLDYGGSIRTEIRNNDTNDLFLEEVSFAWTGTGASSDMDVNKYIAQGETHAIRAMAVPAPGQAGNLGYQISLRLLMQRNGGWYRIIGGGDDWVRFQEHTIEVIETPEDNEYETEYNYRHYYKKVNSLVDLESESVAQAAENATAGIGGEFNMAKACAIFDYLDENCVYTEDDGGDDWLSPDRFLENLEGDCEDYALLISAMVDQEGGKSRIYLTKDHAFAAVYAGNTTRELELAEQQVREYYDSELNIHTFHDPQGYWMVSDPLGSFHMGGPAVGMSPVEEYQGRWNITFEETDLVHSIDVTGLDLNLPFHRQPNFWMGTILIFGFATVMSVLMSASVVRPLKTMCHICGREIQQDPYVCPDCNTVYHRECAFEHAYCNTCRKPIRFPPPPPS